MEHLEKVTQDSLDNSCLLLAMDVLQPLKRKSDGSHRLPARDVCRLFLVAFSKVHTAVADNASGLRKTDAEVPFLATEPIRIVASAYLNVALDLGCVPESLLGDDLVQFARAFKAAELAMEVSCLVNETEPYVCADEYAHSALSLTNEFQEIYNGRT